MKCIIHFYLINDDFSIEYANERYNGEESEMNRRFEWEDELEIKGNATGIQVYEKASIPLEGTMPNGSPFKEELINMRLFSVNGSEGVLANVACSEILLESFDIDENESSLVLKVYLKDKEPFSNPIPGIYAAACEFPEALSF